MPMHNPQNQRHYPLSAPLLSTLVALLFASLTPATSFAQAPEKYNWKLDEEKAGCQIVSSPIAGKEYVAAKATCTVNANIYAVGDVLRDIPNYPKWMHDCKETKMLQVVDKENDKYIFWYRHHVPLLTDRDMILKSSVTKGDGEGTIVATSTNEMTYDASKGYVRMPSFYSEWKIKEIDAGHTKVSFMINPDPGSGVPIGITNSLITTTPFKSIQGLIKVLKEQGKLSGS